MQMHPRPCRPACRLRMLLFASTLRLRFVRTPPTPLSCALAAAHKTNRTPYYLITCLPWYLGASLPQWIGFRLDTISAATLMSAALLAVAVRSFVSPALLGLALTYVLQLTGLMQWFVRQVGGRAVGRLGGCVGGVCFALLGLALA
jgi:hypothetical protein